MDIGLEDGMLIEPFSNINMITKKFYMDDESKL